MFRVQFITRSVATGVALLAVGCEQNTPSEPLPLRPSASQSVVAASTIDSITFESYALGALSAPWSGSSAGNSSIAVVNTPNHGKVLRQNGGKANGDFLSYSYGFTPTSSNLTVEFDIKLPGSASPTFILNGSGYGASKNQFRLQRKPGSNGLIAGNTLSGPNCGNLKNEAWNHVVLSVTSTAPRTFTVRVNGVSVAACTNAPTSFSPPYKAIGVFDPSNAGFGGVTNWDNFYIHN